jgi:hypothetical protein
MQSRKKNRILLRSCMGAGGYGSDGTSRGTAHWPAAASASAPLFVLAALLLAASPTNACLDSCSVKYEPVCCNGRMWYNPCYMLCQFPNVTVYEACPPPPAPPPRPPSLASSPPPPPPSCDPFIYPYTNMTFTSPLDGRSYTLYDLNAACMPDWNTSRTYCRQRGMELAPWSQDASYGERPGVYLPSCAIGWVEVDVSPLTDLLVGRLICSTLRRSSHTHAMSTVTMHFCSWEGTSSL